jgi:MarR family transcriptional regulator, lower aerobic nicotinate degradation pathway regulator
MSRSAGSPSTRTDEIDLGLEDALAQLSFLVWGTLAERASTDDLSMTQIRLLGILRDREPSMLELARLLGLDKSSVTGLVDRAEKRGLLLRAIDTDDHRSFRVSLTRAGRKTVDRVAAAFHADIEAISSCLSRADQIVLSGLASRIVVTHAAEQGIGRLDVRPPL